MLLTRSQLLIIALVFIASVLAWGIVLKMFLDSSLDFKWSVFVWFFGACIVAALVGWSIQVTGAFKRKRHATLNKNNEDINNPFSEERKLHAHSHMWSLYSHGKKLGEDNE